MSFNIIHWRTKSLDNFSILLDAFYHPINDRETMNVAITNPSEMEVYITGYSEGFKVVGILRDGDVYVTDICNYGEGSGWLQRWLKEYIFPCTRGSLLAAITWEDGTLYRFSVVNGHTEETEVDV